MLSYERVRQLAQKAIESGSVAIDIEASIIQDELKGCDTEFVLFKSNGWIGDYWVQLCKYKDQWWAVGHTSLFDDVATGLCARSPEEQTLTVENMLSKILYGVRFHRWKQVEKYGDKDVSGGMSFITHMSDG